MPGFVFRPSWAADLPRGARPRRRRWSRTGDGEDALVQVGGEHRGLDVVAGEPRVVWVRSLVPGRRVCGVGDPVCGQRRRVAARSSCRWEPSASRLSRRPRPRIRLGLIPDQVRLHHRAHQRHHDLDLRILTRGDLIAGRPPMARTCNANRPGSTAEAHSAQTRASGLDSCSLHRGQQPAVGVFLLPWSPWPRRGSLDPRARYGPAGTVCSGGSSSRMVTGSPSIASSNSVKSLRCRGSSAAIAASRSSMLSARMTRSIKDPAIPEEHVLSAHRPILGAKASRTSRVLGGIGVGADGQPPTGVGVGGSTACTSAAVLVVGPPTRPRDRPRW